MKVVEVTWLDARHRFGEVCEAEVKHEAGAPITTVGYLLRRDKEFVVVAMEATEDGWRNVTSIPRAMVKNIRPIEK